MTFWQIVLLVLGIFNVLAVFFSIYMIVSDWRDGKEDTWAHILIGIFIYPVILASFVYAIYEYLKDARKDGGVVAHYRKQKEKERKEKAISEAHRKIEEAYKQGRIRRDQIPKNNHGYIEFYGRLANDDWRDLIYVENSYNPRLNEFFKSHPDIPLKHKMRVIYLPEHVKKISSQEFLEYYHPGSGEPLRKFDQIDSSYLIQDLCYNDDVKELRSGLVVLVGWSLNYGVRSLVGKYYHLEEGPDEEILSQIESIAKKVCLDEGGGIFCQLPPPDEKSTSADDHFDEEVNKLIDEVRERIELLHQRGISRKLLQKMFEEEPQLSRLVITKDYRIILPDYHDMEIKMEPLVKAVYLLFLKHPKGILFKCLPDYRKELTQIYGKLRPYGLTDRALQSIEDVTNPLLNSINEKCARIKGAFVGKFDDSLASNYYIDGWRGEKKSIKLPRKMVIWE